MKKPAAMGNGKRQDKGGNRAKPSSSARAAELIAGNASTGRGFGLGFGGYAAELSSLNKHTHKLCPVFACCELVHLQDRVAQSKVNTVAWR